MEEDRFREKKYLEDTVQRLNKDLDGLVVEGVSDRYVMKKLGFEGKIFLSAERTIEDLVEDVARGTEIIGVFTDFDSHGREQADKISRELNREIDVLNSARKQFGEVLTYNDRYAVEDAAPLFDDKEKKFVEAALDRINSDL